MLVAVGVDWSSKGLCSRPYVCGQVVGVAAAFASAAAMLLLYTYIYICVYLYYFRKDLYT